MIERDSTGESAAVAGGTVVVVAVTVFGASATDKTAPILAFVGAILVALLTAYTANRRQGRALGAESRRLAQQPEHDRELADLAAVRSLLDDAALGLHRALVELPDTPDSIKDDSHRRVWNLVNAELRQDLSRLIVRFGQAHPLVQDFGIALGTLSEWSGAAEAQFKLAPSEGAQRDRGIDFLLESAAECRAAVSPFLDQAAKTAGAQLP